VLNAAHVGDLLMLGRRSRHPELLLPATRSYHTRAWVVRQPQGRPARTDAIVFVRPGDYNRCLEHDRRAADCGGVHATGHALSPCLQGVVLTGAQNGDCDLKINAYGIVFDHNVNGQDRHAM
jgi:hypothetical protein